MDPSLIKAMGGPSSGKAGVSRDPEETNRIIAEASKNSKYFQVRLVDVHAHEILLATKTVSPDNMAVGSETSRPAVAGED